MLKTTLLYIKQGLNALSRAFSPVIIIGDHIYRLLFTHSHLSRLIAKSLYNNTAEKSSSEEIEMLQYGIECIINILIPLIIIFIYAFLSHKTLDMFIWFLSFLLLRNFIGGYHTSSHIRCIILERVIS